MDLNQIRKEVFEDPVPSKLSAMAKGENMPLFLVGGYIRDLLLGIRRKDYDLTLPKESFSLIPKIEKVLGFRFFKVGKEELGTTTYRIIKSDLSIDLTFFQGRTIDDDLQRRDFTINAIAFSLLNERFHWVEGALEDTGVKVIRSVSTHAIDQDPLRMLRAIRYLSTLDGFILAMELKKEISLKRDLIGKLPGERIKMELDQILLSPRRTFGMTALHELGLLLTLFPELKGLESLGQSEYHHLDALSHTLLIIEKIPWASQWLALNQKEMASLSEDDQLALSYGALFHDIGKQHTY